MNNITVICSNYNSSIWIDEYCKFLNNQKGCGFDVIFVDANSTDDSLAKFKNFKFDSKINVKIIELKTRVGVYEAWNIAIKRCNTPYIMNYNTDDLICDTAIDTYNSYLIKYPDVDIFYGPCGFVHTRKIDEYVGFGNWPEYSHEILLQYCICGPFPLLKTESIIKAGYFNQFFVSSGDYEMWLRMSKKGYKFLRIPEMIGSFYGRPDSISANQKIAQVEDYLIQNKYK